MTRPEPRRVFRGIRDNTARRRHRLDPSLPLDLAFLRLYGVSIHKLRRAESEAQRIGASAATVLMAEDLVSARLYYMALADYLDIPFMGGSVAIHAAMDAADVVRHRFTRLAGASSPLLMAPLGPAIGVLVMARQSGVDLAGLAVTTPAHLAALARRAGQERIAHEASFALSDRDPALCARPAVDALVGLTGIGFVIVALGAASLAPRWILGGIGVLFFAAMVCRLMICAMAFRDDPEPPALADRDLPPYSVIVPLYKEADMAAALMDRLDAIDYPPTKLQIIFMLEADDAATRHALEAASLRAIHEIIVAPPGEPRTKPRALSVALPFARGAIVTVFDAEDAPEPLQLRKAAARFRAGADNLACLQASLTVDPEPDTLLTRLFAIEYAILFDLFNRGVGAAGMPMALGGTSNHIKTGVLRAIGGWDAWNVAEDADIGFRLARFGYKADVLASATREQAPRDLASWMKQRRRWTKGWMQTILVVGSHPRRALRDLGTRQALVMLLMAVSLVLGPLLSPVVGVVMVFDFAAYGLPDPRSGADLIAVMLWVSVMILGLAGTLWCGLIGIKRRGLWTGLRDLPLIPPYQLLIAMAAWGGLCDLFTAPYHWHKTKHYPPPDRESGPPPRPNQSAARAPSPS